MSSQARKILRSGHEFKLKRNVHKDDLAIARGMNRRERRAWATSIHPWLRRSFWLGTQRARAQAIGVSQ